MLHRVISVAFAAIVERERGVADGDAQQRAGQIASSS